MYSHHLNDRCRARGRGLCPTDSFSGLARAGGGVDVRDMRCFDDHDVQLAERFAADGPPMPLDLRERLADARSGAWSRGEQRAANVG